jgi:hypothetical protein
MQGREASESGRGHAVSNDNLHGHTPIASQFWEPIGDLAKTAEDISKYIGDSGSPQPTSQKAYARHRCWRDAGAGIQRDNFSRPEGATAARRPQALSRAYRRSFCAVAPILAGWYLMLLPNSGPGMATISPPSGRPFSTVMILPGNANAHAPRLGFLVNHPLSAEPTSHSTVLRPMTRACGKLLHAIASPLLTLHVAAVKHLGPCVGRASFALWKRSARPLW